MTCVPASLKARIIVLSTLVMTVVLVVTSISVMSLFSAGLRDGTDRMLNEDARMLSKLLFLEDGRIELFGHSRRNSPGDALLRAMRFRILDNSGQVIIRSSHFADRDLPLPSRSGHAPHLSDIRLDGEWLRILTVPVELQYGQQRTRVFIQAARSIQPLHHQETRLRRMLLVLLPLAILLVATGCAIVAGIALRPVNRLAARMLTIGVDDLSTRLPVQRQDEIGKLAMAFNRLLERLEDAFRSLRRFTADASHELRSPLMALRTQGEVALDKPRSGQEYRRSIGGMLEDITHLERLTETLLELARADSGMTKLTRKTVDLSACLRTWSERYQPWAEEKGIVMEIHNGLGVLIPIDPTLIERAVGNLLDNATRYTPTGGRVDVILQDHTDATEIRIADTGPGIPAEARSRIFDRFVRLDPARSQEGNGLGLAIVKWVSTLHGGDAYIMENNPVGSCFVIRLPKPAVQKHRTNRAA